MDLPWEPLPCHSGYFMMVDITKCKDVIPQSYFETHDYDTDLCINRLYLPEGHPNYAPNKIPLDLAFVRWMGKDNGVTMMPNCFFYHTQSPYMSENYVRVAICKDIESVKKVCEKLRLIKV